MDEPNVEIFLTDRITTSGNVGVFGRVLDSDENPSSAEVCLLVNGNEVTYLPQTKNGKYYFRVHLGFGIFKIAVCLWKFRVGYIQKKVYSSGKWVLSLNRESGYRGFPWVDRLDLDEVFSRGKKAVRLLQKETNFEKAYLIGRTLVRGWTQNDIDIKLVNSDFEKMDYSEIEGELENLNTIISKEIKYPVDIILGERRVFGHERGKYDLSGCVEVRSLIFERNKGMIFNPKPEVVKYPGRGGKLYENGEEIKREEIEAVESGNFITRGEIS